MSKVTKTSPMLHGHTRVEFEDGSQVVLTRGSKVPEVGDHYGEFVPKEIADAVDAQASETPVVESEPLVEPAAGQDEAGTPSGPGDGAQKEGQ